MSRPAVGASENAPGSVNEALFHAPAVMPHPGDGLGLGRAGRRVNPLAGCCRESGRKARGGRASQKVYRSVMKVSRGRENQRRLQCPNRETP